jgi:uncharacterized protein with NAD-binding domain and iron-sulfur cluster
MAKRKIAILGGGMAGLPAAYELSRTAELRAAYQVTIYQLGWRLGGKCASGRDSLGRIQEHGLHFWFGCYENAFRFLREVYGVLDPGRAEALQSLNDALKPQTFTTLGTTAPGEPAYWPLTWPVLFGTPGEGRLLPSLLYLVGNVFSTLKTLLESAPHMRTYLTDAT